MSTKHRETLAWCHKASYLGTVVWSCRICNRYRVQTPTLLAVVALLGLLTTVVLAAAAVIMRLQGRRHPLTFYLQGYTLLKHVRYEALSTRHANDGFNSGCNRGYDGHNSGANDGRTLNVPALSGHALSTLAIKCRVFTVTLNNVSNYRTIPSDYVG